MRIFQTIGLFACLVGITGTCAHADPAASDAQILHLLNRISFGPLPGQIEAVRRMGLNNYIDLQLHPGMLPPSSALESRLGDLPTLGASMADLAREYQPDAAERKSMSPEERKEDEKRKAVVVKELSEAKILRAVMSPAQLQEVMTDFWYNHFNVFVGKGPDKLFISAYERDAIRPHALGKFRDLLLATSRHPAMMYYLDNWENTDPDSPVLRGKKLGINENYAREVMELHTLGVNGGYTQGDVTALAHILTGWGVSEGKQLEQRSAFFFEPHRHDPNDQIFLGTHIHGGGAEEVVEVLDMLARHPATARHISYELAQYFVADEPPQSLVDHLTATFRSSNGDIADMLRVLFHSNEFWDAKYAQNKFKPPFRYVVSVLRASNIVPPGDTLLLQRAMGGMGEPLYRCVTPNGYANTSDQWLNSDALLKRVDFAGKLADLMQADPSPYIFSAFGATWSGNTVDTINNAEPKMKPVLALSSPEFVYY